METSVIDVAHSGRAGQQDAPEWQDTREEQHYPSPYSPSDNEQLPYDVPLPMGLIQDHPEPLLIDRRLISGTTHQASGKQSQNSAAADSSGYDASSRRGDVCDSEDSSGAMPVCNAEPMTREEADAFDKGSMGSCFLEFGAFGMSHMSKGGASDSNLRTAASQSVAEALHRFQAKGVLSRPSMEEGREVQPSDGSTDGDPGSNRSSFDSVPAAASSRLYNSTAWEDCSNATQAPTTQPATGGPPPAVKAQQLQGRPPQATAQAAVQGSAPSNARAAHQALGLGLPDKRPQLTPLTPQEVMQANLRQVHSKEGGLEQGKQQQQQRRGTTPVLQQSHMQLSLGMGLGLTLDLGSWHYGMAPGGDAAAGQNGGAVIPRVTAATHRRRAGAPVEEFASEQAAAKQSHNDPPTWPAQTGVAAVSVQNVCNNHLGTALTAPDLIAPAPKGRAAQDAANAEFAQRFAAAVKQEALQGREGGALQRHFDDVHTAVAGFNMRNAARLPCKTGGQELSVRHESLERYRDKKRRRVFSNTKTIRYEKRKVNADRRPRVKGRFVKQMETDGPLDMIDEHCQALPAPDTDMEHASDAECSGDDEGPLNLKVHGEMHASHMDIHLI